MTVLLCLEAGETVCITFPDDGSPKNYHVQWEELLDMDGVPFLSYDQAVGAGVLLAPYTTGDGTVQFATATIVQDVQDDSGTHIAFLGGGT